ncbi:hypothetical protein BDW62DRAFT_76043 [Aspergillus aurantiobrunneus]
MASSYDHDSKNIRAAFPFHRACFKILTRVIGDVDKDLLYQIFTDLAEGICLNLFYGSLVGPGAKPSEWVCFAGEEFAVTDPIDIPDLRGFLSVKLHSFVLDSSAATPEFQWRKGTDQLAQLPYDILILVLQYLPGTSIATLLMLPRYINRATRHNSLWKTMIRERKPWLWELQDVLRECNCPSINYRRFFLRLDRELSVMYGLRLPLNGLANRKRIWDACELIRDVYIRYICSSAPVKGINEQAKAIMEREFPGGHPVGWLLG